jgi:Holliday junction resolvase RusA-like endonuclease
MIIKLDLIPEPRKKEQYLAEGKMKNILADEYQEDIKDKAMISIHHSKKDFPISGGISIFIDFYTNRKMNIIGIIKNVLDGLNGAVFTDDIKVRSILAKIHSTEASTQERTTVKVMSGRSIPSLHCDVDKFKNFLILTVEVDSILEDRYLLYPGDMSTTELVGVNKDTDSVIAREVESNYHSNIIEFPVEVSVVINTVIKDESDLDNLSANYLYNLQGSAIKDLQQVEALLLNKNYVDSGKENIVIEIKKK